MLSRIIVLVVAGVAVVYIVRFIDNFFSQRRSIFILNTFMKQNGDALTNTLPRSIPFNLRENLFHKRFSLTNISFLPPAYYK